MSKIYFNSIHEHKILICFFFKSYKSNKSNKILEYQTLKKNKISNYIFLEDDSYVFLKCLNSGCDIIPNKIKNENYDPKLIEKRYLEYTSNPGCNKDIVFSLNDYYKIDKFDAFDNEILLGTNEEIKKYFANKIVSTPYNMDKIMRSLNFLYEMNEKKIKILDDQKQRLKLENSKINEENQSLIKENQKLIKENKTLKKDFKNLESKSKDNQKIKEENINLSNEKDRLNRKCYELHNHLEKAISENILCQNEIKDKNKKLDEFEKGINFKIENSSEKGEYDIVIGIDSMHSLKADGWKIKYPKGKEEYERKMKMEVIIVGVIGNRNKGKSFILQKLSILM